ncbi:archaellin/type IV pilin N-terminal domain-containing protein [Bacteroidota bacterium]
MNKRGLSPIIATVLLIAFAVAIGAMIMSWTAGIVKESPECKDLPEDIISPNAFCKLTDKVIPRIKTDSGYTACEDHAIEVSKLTIC